MSTLIPHTTPTRSPTPMYTFYKIPSSAALSAIYMAI